MLVIIVLGIIFTLWQGLITHLLPTHTRQYYRIASDKLSTGIPLALIGLMDILSTVGLIVVSILSFFFMPVYFALLFCAVIGLALLFNPSARRHAKSYRKALKGSDK